MRIPIVSWWATANWNDRRGIGFRIAIPSSVGLLCGLLAADAAASSWMLLPTIGFAIALALLLGLRKESPSPPTNARISATWLRWGLVSLSVAFLGSAADLALCLAIDRETSARLAGFLGLAGGLGAMIVNSVDDWRRVGDRDQHYAIVATPWLSALALGLLGSWLVVLGLPKREITASDQAILGCAVLAIMANPWPEAEPWPEPCPVCGTLEMWQNMTGRWRCMKCDPPRKAIRLLERTKRIQRRYSLPDP